MPKFTTNAEANVSAAKGVTGGYAWRAPVGTTLPDAFDWLPNSTYFLTQDTQIVEGKTYYTYDDENDEYTEVETPEASALQTYYEKESAWECMGYITEDGETFSTTADVQEFRDQNGDLMDTSQSTYGETFSCSFAETKESTFQSIYGDDAVTDSGGTLKVSHTGAEPGIYTYAFLFLLKNGRKWVRYAEKCKRTSIGDLSTNSSSVLAWNATYQVVRSETTGSYFEDLFESTETEE